MWAYVWWCIGLFVVTIVLRKLLSVKPSKVKFHFKFILGYFLTFLIALVVWPLMLLRPKDVKNAKATAQIAKHITKLINVRWELRNGQILSEDRGAIIVSNHQYSLDILGMFNIWHVVDKLAAVAKKEIFYIGPIGLTAYFAGTVFIDRKNAKNAYKQLKITTEVMVRKKTKLWLFPEGTRNRNKTGLLPFKKGAFTVALSAQVPIIPVVFSPYYFINEQKSIFNEGHIIIKCLNPIPTTGLTMDDLPKLMNRVHELMDIEFKKLSKEVLDPLPPEYPLASFLRKMQ
ncbi:1-acyl-sn-glycerol-3-phosphate acyltransferase beta-like [Hyposmocoma kahamanoa]|uniref:1-acyl-sn-glycerol-3-phosphate acyltransferase beta-like n=1 Tax=Hyposmocoma kahamanoa TaxID=1477025 RepID=UPI000E6D72FC|nr:1-acyl-sn-glycerol-3-phosphate acyltransferase beta-like [Hyposmocoma kahamanoa]